MMTPRACPTAMAVLAFLAKKRDSIATASGVYLVNISWS